MRIGLCRKMPTNMPDNDSAPGIIPPVVDAQATPGRASPSLHVGSEHDGPALIRLRPKPFT